MIVLIDAAYRVELGIAGLGVVLRESNQVIATEALHVDGSCQAEALAGIRAACYLASQQVERATLWTDARAMVERVSRAKRLPPVRGDVFSELARMLAVRAHRLEWRYRGDIALAHNAAVGARKAYEAGVEGKSTWTPSPYLKKKHAPSGATG